MFDASIDNEAIACVNIDDLASDIDANGSLDDIDELMMRMAVTGANPVRLEKVADEHELVGVGENLPAHTGLGGEGLRILVPYKAHAVFHAFSLRCEVRFKN
jgi:hypothetical protein